MGHVEGMAVGDSSRRYYSYGATGNMEFLAQSKSEVHSR